MASGKTLRPLVLVAMAVMVGMLIHGASADSSFVRRRLDAHHPAALGEGKATVVADAVCLIPCLLPHTTCCPGLFGFGLCASTFIDNFNCGACGNACALGSLCYCGTCRTALSLVPDPKLTDPNNCGSCGNKCPKGDGCNFGVCGGYAT
ncbi:unnamed protein product [Calypogeia fissa]